MGRERKRESECIFGIFIMSIHVYIHVYAHVYIHVPTGGGDRT